MAQEDEVMKESRKTIMKNLQEVFNSIVEASTEEKDIDMLVKISNNMLPIKTIGEEIMNDIIVCISRPAIILDKYGVKIYGKTQRDIIRYMSNSYNELYKILMFYSDIQFYKNKYTSVFWRMYFRTLSHIFFNKAERRISKQMRKATSEIVYIDRIAPSYDLYKLMASAYFNYRGLLLYVLSILKNSQYK